MVNEFEIKKQICEVGKRMYDRNMVASNDGNISVRIGADMWLCTPTGVSKGFMTPNCICKVNAKGDVIQGARDYRPSSEMKMHLRVYEKRPDVKAVVHAHPAYATSYAVAGIPLNKPISAETIVVLGCVPIAEYGTPSTTEIPDNIEKYLQHYDAILLESHGALTWGEDLINAYHKMESVEFYAQLLYQSEVLGGPKEFSHERIQSLYKLRKSYGLSGKHPADICLNKGGSNCHNCSGETPPEKTTLSSGNIFIKNN